MIQKWTKSICALALALLFTPLVTAEAHDRGRRHRHRDDGTISWLANHNTNNNGVRRRVRRGRNMTPGVRRGPFTRTTTTIKSRKNRVGAASALGGGHKRGHGKH